MAAVAPSAPWTEKHRPAHLREVQGHVLLRDMLQRAAARGCVGLPPLILYGPPGTGKTSLALALAADTYPALPMPVTTLYLNASDERSIEVVRDRILDFVRSRWPGVGRKFVIFDEVETMTEPAQLSLRALLDEATAEPDAPHAPLFLFLCNTLYRVHASLRNRAVPFFVGHLSAPVVRGAIAAVEAREGLAHPSEPLSDVSIALLRGDMRALLARAQARSEAPNAWEAYLTGLDACGSDGQRVEAHLAVGAQRVPTHVLARHLLVWLHAQGKLVGGGALAEELVATLTAVRDLPAEVAVPEVARAWCCLAGGTKVPAQAVPPTPPPSR